MELNEVEYAAGRRDDGIYMCVHFVINAKSPENLMSLV